MKAKNILRIWSVFMITGLAYSCVKDELLFEQIKSSASGIEFNNLIVENDTVNQLDIENVYNGGGVGIGDFNNDGLPDVFFTGNLVSCKMYLNKGKFNFNDVYLVVNEISKRISPYQFRNALTNGDNPSTGRLYRNDWSDSLKHAVFKDVSKEAGIQTEGYGHSAIITDINNDGWQDIFVGNDFLTSDLLWINKGDGSFTDKLKDYFKHTATNSMGNDIGDVNNDMLPDIVSLDMNPEDNYRKKMMLMPASYQTYQNSEMFGYSYQYVRNTLQLNMGNTVHQNDSIGHPVFSEIGYFSGISATDWSWTPLLADFDNDGFRDLLICNGFNSPAYQDNFYENDGKGNFKEIKTAVPQNFTSKFCVRANDFDKDGDVDLFVAGRVAPWLYPMPVSSFLLRNDSKHGRINFTDITNETAPELIDIGLVCDAIFTDFNNDGWTDLMLAGEWMPVTFFQNEKGKFRNITKETGLSDDIGWWNSITTGDFDNDNDIDYIVGNLGQNSFYKASPQYPVSVYAGDFDNNGSYDAFPALYLTVSQTDKSKKEYPAHTRDDAIKQMLKIRTLFTNYKSYANSTIQEIFTPDVLTKALKVSANNFNSSFIRNNSNGKFSLSPLPALAQISVLNGMITDDFNGDGNLDILINGNDYSTEVLVGRYDALNGLLLIGNGEGGFTPKSISRYQRFTLYWHAA